MSENDLFYLRSILGQLREFQSVILKGPPLGGEVLADNIDWLDCFIDGKTKRRDAEIERLRTERAALLEVLKAVDKTCAYGDEMCDALEIVRAAIKPDNQPKTGLAMENEQLRKLHRLPVASAEDRERMENERLRRMLRFGGT